MYETLLANALQSGATKNGYKMDAAREYLATHTPDLNDELYALAGTCSWAYNEHGTIQYKGCVYDYQQTEKGYIVKRSVYHPSRMTY